MVTKWQGYSIHRQMHLLVDTWMEPHPWWGVVYGEVDEPILCTFTLDLPPLSWSRVAETSKTCGLQKTFICLSSKKAIPQTLVNGAWYVIGYISPTCMVVACWFSMCSLIAKLTSAGMVYWSWCAPMEIARQTDRHADRSVPQVSMGSHKPNFYWIIYLSLSTYMIL